jgi:gamma-glutamylcyclotransferase (GGCT)/AIG2-like uncharacterized protein YtfP
MIDGERSPVEPGGWLDVVAVYGTLRRGERNHALLATARFLGTGMVAGALHDMPATNERAYGYPALIVGDGEIVVELYRLADPQMLARLDVLEAFDPLDETGSEYVRVAVDVAGGPVSRAWVYRYAADRTALGPRIPSGDWRQRDASGDAAPG